MITSETNAQMKKAVKLQKSARARKKEGLFVVEGIKLVGEAFSEEKLEKVYFSETAAKEHQELFLKWGKSVFCEVVADAVFSAVSDTVSPQGVLGIACLPEYTLDSVLESGKRRFLLLDNIRDPGNLGTIMRTAEGAGISAVILSKESVDLFNPKVVRATMGSVFRVPFCYVENLFTVIDKLKERDIPTYGCTMEGSIRFDLADYRAGAAVVIGNEANGISCEVKSHLSGTIHIPMAGKLESLNASVAAAILMYELVRGDFYKG